MKKKNISRNLIVPIVIFLILIAVFLIFKFINNLGKYKVFVIDGSEMLLYQESNKEWFYIDREEFIEKYKDKSYTLYVDGSSKDSYYYKVIDDKLEMINKSNEVVTRYTDREYTTSCGSASINYITVRSSNKYDEKVVYNILEKNNLYKDYSPSYIHKYSVNVDSDIDLEDIYILSNAIDYDNKKENTNIDKMFTFMYLVDNGNMYEIYSNVDDSSNMCIPKINSLFRFSDGSYKMFVFCDNTDKKSTRLDIYSYKNHKFSKININN